jgi:hypothetical protein
VQKDKSIFFNKELKIAAVVAAFFSLIFIIRVNSNFSFTRVRLEIRNPEKAANILRIGTETKLSSSNNPAGCAFEPKSISYLDNLKLALLVANSKIYNFPESVHSMTGNTEYIFEITNKNKKAEYYYSPDKLPAELENIKEIVMSPWSNKLKSLDF